METKAATLERPRAVQLAAAVLIMTPILDYLMQKQTGHRIFDPADWVLISLGGFSLMIRHKSAWFFGMLLSLSFVMNTAYGILTNYQTMDAAISTLRLLDCLLVLFIVATVFAFFRYPYLDRRQKWMAPTADRFLVNAAVTVDGINLQTIDLSYTGARLVVPAEVKFTVGDVLGVQFPEINDITCRAKVLDIQSDCMRVDFSDMAAENKDLLRQWLQSQNLQKL